MLSSISWSQYISAVAVFLVCYYLYVGYKYFRWEFLGLIGVRKVEPGSPTFTAAEFKQQISGENNTDFLPKEANPFPVLHTFKDEVMAYLLEAGNFASKEELLHSLQNICSKYAELKNATVHAELNAFILDAVKRNSYEKIFREDIQQLWR